MKRYRESRRIAPLILKTDARWEWLCSSPVRFATQKLLLYPLERKPSGPYSQCGRFEE